MRMVWFLSLVPSATVFELLIPARVSVGSISLSSSSAAPSMRSDRRRATHGPESPAAPAHSHTASTVHSAVGAVNSDDRFEAATPTHSIGRAREAAPRR